MAEVKKENVRGWANNFIKDVESNSKSFEDTLEKKKIVSLLLESVKIIKRLLKENG